MVHKRGKQNQVVKRISRTNQRKFERQQAIRDLYAKGDANVKVMFVKKIIRPAQHWKQLQISNTKIEKKAKRISFGHVIIVDDDTLEVVCVARFGAISNADAEFLAEFFYELGKYSRKVTSNGSQLSGTMYATGHRRAYHQDYIAGIYSANSATQKSFNMEQMWILLLQTKLPRVEQIYREWFANLSEPIFYTMQETTQGLIPSFSTTEYSTTTDEPDDADEVIPVQLSADSEIEQTYSDTPLNTEENEDYVRLGGIQSKDFASNLTWTLNDFFNKLHRDRDANPYAYGIWFTTLHNKLTTNLEPIGCEKGHFYIPEYDLYIDFGNNVVEIIWRGRSDFHCTTPSKCKQGYQRIGSSIQIARTLLNVLLSEHSKKYKGLEETLKLAECKK